MKDFQKIDWKLYNRPPFYQQWLCRDDTLKLTAFGDKGLAEVDEQILALKDLWDLDNVKAALLDRIGKIVAEKRDGNEDELYRLLIHLRILLNTADGTVNDIIKVLKFIYRSEIVHIQPAYPAGITILHDGERPSVNFREYIVQVIGAGIAYDIRELFDFLDSVTVSELSKVSVRRGDYDTFGHPIKYNGAIKYDGHTVNDMVWVKNKYDGTFKYNGAIKYNGMRKIKNPFHHTPPFKYSFSSSISDTMSVLKSTLRDFSDTVSMTEDVSMGMTKHHLYNGAYKYDGAINYDSGILFPLA